VRAAKWFLNTASSLAHAAEVFTQRTQEVEAGWNLSRDMACVKLERSISLSRRVLDLALRA